MAAPGLRSWWCAEGRCDSHATPGRLLKLPPAKQRAWERESVWRRELLVRWSEFGDKMEGE
eukprot:3636472-Pleurochrysis_carterae.AAC.2